MVEVGCFRSAFCSHGIRVVNFVFVIVFLDPGGQHGDGCTVVDADSAGIGLKFCNQASI